MTCVRVGTGRRRWIICTADEPLKVPDPDCPNAAQHTPQPSGYVALSEWADDMLKTHDQEKCPACGRPLIWRPRTDHDHQAQLRKR